MENEEIVKIINNAVNETLDDRDDIHLFCIIVKGEIDCEDPKALVIRYGDTLTTAKGLTKIMHENSYIACICTNAVCDYMLDRTQVRMLTKADILDDVDDD